MNFFHLLRNRWELVPVWKSGNVQDTGVVCSLLAGNHTLHLKVIHVQTPSDCNKYILGGEIQKWAWNHCFPLSSVIDFQPWCAIRKPLVPSPIPSLQPKLLCCPLKSKNFRSQRKAQHLECRRTQLLIQRKLCMLHPSAPLSSSLNYDS